METLLTIALAGLFAGFIFSVPVAGPISILITSYALKGKFNFALVTAIGAALVDSLYCFIAVFGFSQLYILYQPLVPYTLLGGAFFMTVLGYKIIHMHIKLDSDDAGEKPKLRKRGRFLTGIMVSLLNPSLFFGWLTSSFVIMSFTASLGINIGGLDTSLGKAVESIQNDPVAISQQASPDAELSTLQKDSDGNPVHPLIYSLAYALAVGMGSIIWFFNFSKFLVKHRHKLKIDIIDKIIHLLGFGLWAFALYLSYSALRMIGLFT